MESKNYLGQSYYEDYLLGVMLNELKSNPKGGFNTVKAVDRINSEYLEREEAKFLVNTLKTAVENDESVNGSVIKEKAIHIYGMAWWDTCKQYFMDLSSSHTEDNLFDEALNSLHRIHSKLDFERSLKEINDKVSDLDLEDAKKALVGLVEGSDESVLKEADLDDVLDDILNGETTFIHSGSEKLDMALGGGFEPGQMIVLAGRPGAGKSSYSMQLMTNRQLKSHKTLFYTMEMKAKKVLIRMVAQKMRKPLHGLKHIQKAPMEEKVQVTNAVDEINNGMISIYDEASQTIEEIASEVKAKIREAESTNGVRPSLIVIDYLGLISIKETVEYVALSYLSREIKKLAMECGVAILILAQLNRKLEERALGNQKPKLSDLRGSGAIEQDADTIIFVHREAMYDPDIDRNQPHEALAVIAKAREGEVLDVPYEYLPHCGVWL